MAGGDGRPPRGQVERRHIHPEIINMHLGPDLLSLHEGDRLETDGKEATLMAHMPSPPPSVLYSDLKRQADLPRVTPWTAGNTKVRTRAQAHFQTTKLTDHIRRSSIS